MLQPLPYGLMTGWRQADWCDVWAQGAAAVWLLQPSKIWCTYWRPVVYHRFLHKDERKNWHPRAFNMTMDMSPKTLKFERIFPAMSRSMRPSPSSKSSRTSLWSRRDPCSSQASRRSGLALALTDPGQVGRCVQQAWALAGRNKLGATWICGFSWQVKYSQRLTPDWPFADFWGGFVWQPPRPGLVDGSRASSAFWWCSWRSWMGWGYTPTQCSTALSGPGAWLTHRLEITWPEVEVIPSSVLWCGMLANWANLAKYPLVNCYITKEHHNFHGKINDFDGPFSIAM